MVEFGPYFVKAPLFSQSRESQGMAKSSNKDNFWQFYYFHFWPYFWTLSFVEEIQNGMKQ